MYKILWVASLDSYYLVKHLVPSCCNAILLRDFRIADENSQWEMPEMCPPPTGCPSANHRLGSGYNHLADLFSG